MNGRMQMPGAREFANGRELLSLKEAAQLIGRSEVTLGRYARGGVVRCFTRGPGRNGAYFFSRTGLLKQFSKGDQ